MTAFVRETKAGWEVVEGGKVTAYRSQVGALDAALATYSVAKKTAVLRDADSGTPNGAWRWIQAATAEDAPAGDGKRIAESTLDEALAHLNSSLRARVIDGGTADSETHGSEFTAGATPATGWAHAAVRAINAAGHVCVYVLAEVLASVADALDTGRLAFASIAVRGRKAEDGTMVDARFSSMALTNLAVADDLQPTSAIRAEEVEVRFSSAVRSLRPETSMSKLSIRTRLGAGHLALRGPAIDKVVEVARSLGVDPDAEFSADEWESPTKAAWCAIRSAAMAEKILEAIPPSAPAGDVAAARAAMNGAIRRTLGLRAEIADADLEALCKALGLPPGSAMADIIKAAEAKKPAEPPKEPMAAATEAARSEKLTALETEVAALRADKDAREDAAWLDGEIAKRKVAVRAESRSAFLTALRSDRKDGRTLVSGLLDTIPTPPTGTVIKGAQPETDPTSTPDTKALIDAEVAAVRSESPSLNDAQVRREAYLRAAKKNPAAFAA